MLKLTWQRYELRDPYHYKGEARAFKESALLGLTFQQQVFFSELSVFPGLHPTERQLYHEQLPADLFQKLTLPKSVLTSALEVKNWAHSHYDSKNLPANTLQALDALMLEVLGAFKLLPANWQNIFGAKTWSCPCAELITNLENSLHLRDQTCVFKVKMGRSPLEEETRWLKQWLQQNPKAQVRLDANEMWSPKEVKTLLSNLTPTELHAIDYLEDPCPQNKWAQVDFAETPKLALEQWGPDSSCTPQVWTYRPSSQKGLFLGLCELENHLKESGHIDVVLSSSFETALGLAPLVFMANVLGLTREQGLGTLTHLTVQTPLVNFLQSRKRNGQVFISRNP